MARADIFARSGLLILILGSAVDSTSGLITRLLGTDAFTAAAGRGLFPTLALGAVLWWREGGRAPARLAAVGAAGAAFVALNSLGMVMNILSLRFTAVANFFMIFATAPFVAALAGRVFLAERLDRATLAAFTPAHDGRARHQVHVGQLQADHLPRAHPGLCHQPHEGLVAALVQVGA